MIKEDKEIEVIYKGGGSIISLPPVFSNDAEYLYVATAYNITSYNVLTGNKVIEFSRVSSEIIGFGIGIINDVEHIIACSKNGRIVLWKLNTGLKIREIKTGIKQINFFKIFSAVDDENNETVKAFICCESKYKKKYDFGILNFQTEIFDTLNLRVKLKGKIHVDVADNGKFVAVVQKGVLYYYRSDLNISRRHFIRDRIFTYVCCHPTEEIVLTGDNTGRAVIWENLQNKSPAQAVYHWHTLPVISACFSKSGSQFFSGGAECVLVKWILNDTHKTFLARLPGFIQHISVAPNNLYIALSIGDNSIQIVTPQLKIKNSIQHLVVGNSLTTELGYDPRSNSLVFNGISGHVQFFSPRNLDLVYSLDVAGQNKYTDERETSIINTSVTHVSIDKTGLWMATVEERRDPNMFESCLKFWFYDTTNQSYSLNTSVEYPHEGSVKKLLFQPSNDEKELYCVTTGSDKKFKLWQVVPLKTVYREGLIWECTSDVTYRNLHPNVPSFSSDGSLLAVGFESIVTVWLPDMCELKCSLRHPIQNDDLCHVSFGTDSHCHLLVSATRKSVSVWNLLGLVLVWTVSIDVHYVVSDVTSSIKAVFTEDKKLYVFEPHVPAPIHVIEKLKSIPNVRSAAFVPRRTITMDVTSNWAQRLSIYVLTSNFELFAIESPINDVTENSLQIKEDQSFLKNMLPEIKSALFKDQSQVHSYAKDIQGKKFQELLNTPVPSLQLSFLCEDILGDSLVQKNPTHSTVDTAVEEKSNKSSDNVTHKCIDKNLSLDSVCTEKMQWTLVLSE